MNILILAAHPDDEVLGMGATIKKLSERKNKIHLCVVSEGASAQYRNKKFIKLRKEACIKSGKILGIRSIDFLDFPDMRLDTIPHLEINIKLEKIIKKFRPEVVYTTPSNDLNLDHRKVFESTLVVTRPFECSVKNILSYEIPGHVQEPFVPTFFENITKYLPSKIKAFQCYKSEIKKFPHSRSNEAIENLAIQRGIESGLKKAEAFKVIRSISE